MLTGFRPRWKTSGWCAQNPVAISEDTQNEMKKRYKFVTQILAFGGTFPSPQPPKGVKTDVEVLGKCVMSCATDAHRLSNPFSPLYPSIDTRKRDFQ